MYAFRVSASPPPPGLATQVSPSSSYIFAGGLVSLPTFGLPSPPWLLSTVHSKPSRETRRPSLRLVPPTTTTSTSTMGWSPLSNHALPTGLESARGTIIIHISIASSTVCQIAFLGAVKKADWHYLIDWHPLPHLSRNGTMLLQF